MRLSEDENRMIEKLRKSQQMMRRWRVPLSILPGVSIVAWFSILISVTRLAGIEFVGTGKAGYYAAVPPGVDAQFSRRGAKLND